MKKTILILLITMVCFASAQQKKKIIKDTFDKDFIELLTSTKNSPHEALYYDQEFPLGGQYEKPVLLSEDPKVTYLQKSSLYYYLFKLEDVNIALYLKDNKIVEKTFTVFDLSDFISLIHKYDINNKEFISGKGFKISDNNYVMISKTRQDKYDSYSLDFRSAEFFNIRDLLRSEN